MEIRTRKVIRRYVSKDGGCTLKRPKTFDREEYYYRRHAQRNRCDERYSPAYRIIEPREPLRPRTSLNTLWRRDLSPVRSQPFKMRLPYMRRVAPVRDNLEPEPSRGRSRSARPFVVDPAPEIRYAWPKSERLRSPSPEIRCVSPRRSSPRRPSPRPLKRETETTVIVDDIPRRPRTLERHNSVRPPRERTPVVEREPVKRKQNPVEIHQSPERRKGRERSSGRRQVRFAEDIQYEEYGSRSPERNEHRQPESDSEESKNIRRRIHERRIPIEIDGRPNVRRLFPERTTTYRRIDTETLRPRPSERSRLRPRIIQDGDCELSQASDRIYAAARRRRDQARHMYDFVPHSSSRWRNRFDDIDFSSDDDSYLLSRRYGWRWR
ncbi:hypothetical protein ASPVEDRAFT_40554 [Aspergillus versicolor CBS 583.65]|uniref:Uncharacterized protein n=1 Tax=Aspergillus versicolor CBS 583.65 TaxID=1036611 RepID=A0A1L9PHN8_ASPVE|nr:uncharacterized protein ASPVEDRAFT_40554 [Aspergillus versicolor CBS 583.65]OJJ01029.1 hypothetical protein ASPVEDRAFT_40554 [Aspergillus versicolor CBS 583.65]